MRGTLWTNRLAALGLTALMAGCGWLNKGAGSLLTNPIKALLSPDSAQSPVAQVRAGTVAIGTQMAVELQSNLVNAGLTPDQAAVVTDSSKQEVDNTAGTIVLTTGSLALDAQLQKPIVYAAGPVVKGAVEVLGNPQVGLGDLTRRAAILQVIMSSTFTSLGGRVGDLDKTTLLDLHKGMVGSAVKSLNDGGLGGDQAPGALQKVTAGAVSALAKSVGADDASDAAQSVVAGAVSNLNAAGLPATLIKDMVSSAAAGVVANLKAAGVADPAAAAGAVAQTSVTSLAVLALPAAQILQATEGAAKGAVSALAATGITNLAAVVQAATQIAQATVQALKTAGVDDDSIGKAAGSCASGAIQGLAGAGVTSSQLASGNGAAAIVAAAAGALKNTGVAAAKIAAHIDDVGVGALTALAPLTGTDSTAKSTILTSIITGVGSGMKAAGLSDAAVLAAASSMSQKATEALTSDGFDSSAAASAAGTIVAASLVCVSTASSVAIDVTTVTQTMSAAVGAGAAQSNIAVDAHALLVQVNQAVTQIAPQTANVANVLTAAMNGVASGAALATPAGSTSTVLSSLQQQIASGAATQGLSGVNTQSLNTSLQAAVTQAQTLASQAASLPDCATVYPDTLTHEAFEQTFTSATQPVYCKSATSTCPETRPDTGDDGYTATWAPVGTTGTCSLGIMLVFDGGGTPRNPVACSTVTASSTNAQVEAIGIAEALGGGGGALCTKAPGTPCPPIPGDAPAGTNWVNVGMSSVGDSCYYYNPLDQNDGDPSCADLFGAATSLTSAQIAAETGDAFGDLACTAPTATSCPTPADPSTYAFQAGTSESNGASTIECQYGRIYHACSYESETLAGTDVVQMDTAVNDETVRTCTLTGDTGLPTLASELVNAGFSQPFPRGYPNGTRLAIFTFSTPCSEFGATVSASTLSKFQPESSLFAYTCDTPGSSAQCPSADASLSGADSVPISGFNVTRCRYAEALPACGVSLALGIPPPASLTASALSTSYPLLQDYSSFDRWYACDAGSSTGCQLDSPLMGAGFSATFVTVGTRNACVTTVNIPFCQSTVDDVNNLGQLGGIYACDLPASATTCPAYNTDNSRFDSFNAMGAPAATAGFQRCYAVPMVSSCAGVGTIDAAHLTGETWRNGGGGSSYGCTTTPALSSCPSGGPNFSMDSATPLPGGGNYCEYNTISSPP